MIQNVYFTTFFQSETSARTSARVSPITSAFVSQVKLLNNALWHHNILTHLFQFFSLQYQHVICGTGFMYLVCILYNVFVWLSIHPPLNANVQAGHSFLGLANLRKKEMTQIPLNTYVRDEYEMW